jgi:hypothetical protein
MALVLLHVYIAVAYHRACLHSNPLATAVSAGFSILSADMPQIYSTDNDSILNNPPPPFTTVTDTCHMKALDQGFLCWGPWTPWDGDFRGSVNLDGEKFIFVFYNFYQKIQHFLQLGM